jgi:hypothetical protein
MGSIADESLIRSGLALGHKPKAAEQDCGH